GRAGRARTPARSRSVSSRPPRSSGTKKTPPREPGGVWHSYGRDSSDSEAGVGEVAAADAVEGGGVVPPLRVVRPRIFGFQHLALHFQIQVRVLAGRSQIGRASCRERV